MEVEVEWYLKLDRSESIVEIVVKQKLKSSGSRS